MKNSIHSRLFFPGIKFNTPSLLYLAFICLLLFTANILIVDKQNHPQMDKMIVAADRMKSAFSEIRKLRTERELYIDDIQDPLQSGFIGVEFSPITTTIGNLEAKQTAVNPDFAALFIHWFFLLDLEEGSHIIIHASGSFPSLSIAAIIASEVYGLEPLILSSAGSSSFGANHPDLTYWDMEKFLFLRGIIQHHTQYATPGGQNDNGMSFWQGGMQIIQNAAKRNNYTVYVPVNLEEAISNKLRVINKHEPIRLFINIGGNQAAMGDTPCSLGIPPGLILSDLACNSEKQGLIHLINKKKIAIIHLLSIRNLAVQNGVSLNPEVVGRSGEGDIYIIETHPFWLQITSIIFIILNLIIITIYNWLSHSVKF